MELEQRIIAIELSKTDWNLLLNEVEKRDNMTLPKLISKMLKNEIDRRVR